MTTIESKADRFIRLVSPHERQLYFQCFHMLGNQQDAEDCAQEAMLKAFRSFDRFRGDSKLSTWLYTIASRCCTDLLRKRKELLSLESLQEEGWDAPSQEPSPYLSLEASERKRLLKKAIHGLPALQRQVVVLCDLNGLSYEEAAVALDCPVGTVRSRLSRGRQELKRQLSGEMELSSHDARPNIERRENNAL